MTNILGPQAGGQVTVRPARAGAYGPSDSWFKSCSSSTANDGTVLDADAFNDWLAQFRTLFVNAAIVRDDGDDMLWRAVQAATGIRYGTDTGTANNVVVALTPTLTALGFGKLIAVKIAAGNTGPTTLTADGTPATAVKNVDGSALAPNNLRVGMMALFLNDGAVWQLLNPAAATAAVSGAVVGNSRKLKGSADGSNKLAAFSWDELTLVTVLGGATFKSGNQTLPFNGAAAGAGGMDTGAMPAAGDLYIYAIFNPTTLVTALLGTTAGAGASVYSGANMPAGFTYSALVSALKTSGGNISAFLQLDREIQIAYHLVLVSGNATSVTPISIAAYVPPNAQTVSGVLVFDTASPLEQAAVVQPNSTNQVGAIFAEQQGGTGGVECSTVFPRMILSTAQTLYYNWSPGGETGASTIDVSITGYSI